MPLDPEISSSRTMGLEIVDPQDFSLNAAEEKTI